MTKWRTNKPVVGFDNKPTRILGFWDVEQITREAGDKRARLQFASQRRFKLHGVWFRPIVKDMSK